MYLTMKHIGKILISLLVISGLFCSCSGLLDIDQHGATSPETFYKTDEEAEEAITAVYAKLAGIYYNYYFVKNLLSDDFWCGGGGRGDNADFEKLNEFTFSADHPIIRDLFKNYYEVLYLSNIVLKYVPDGSPIQKRARAEARVFRAYIYIDLISLWGTPPLVDKPLEPSEYKQPNGDPAALWNLVETDLKEAIASGALEEKSGVNDDSSYRVKLQFAKALLGKAYVFQQKWSDACTILDDMIDDGKYDLYRGDYADILMYNAENNCESLFEVNRLNDPNNAFTNWSFFSAMVGWRGDRMSISSGVYPNCWGFCNPKKDLYDAFVAVEGKDGYRLNSTMKSFDKLLAQGDKILDGKEMYDHEGYFWWKNRVLADEMILGGFFSSHNNYRYMRYAEVLLLAAEAHVKGGDKAKAANYLNAVRTRAHLSELGSVTMDDVMTEKRLELCGEGVRFQDMQRWGIAADRLKDQGKQIPWFASNGTTRWEVYNKSLYGYKTGKHELLPFPETEVTLNPNVKQNPNW